MTEVHCILYVRVLREPGKSFCRITRVPARDSVFGPAAINVITIAFEIIQ